MVLYETGGVSSQFKKTLTELASKIWAWKSIIWAFDIITLKRKYGQIEVFEMHRLLRATIEIAKQSVNEIWVCFINRPSEKIVLDAYPNAKIVLYEDGLTSYLPVEKGYIHRGALVRHRIKNLAVRGVAKISPAFRLRKTSDRIDESHLKRTIGFYSLLADLAQPNALSTVPRYQVDASLMRNLISAVSLDALEAKANCKARPRLRILMLGQALSRNGVMTYEQEAGIYGDVADQIIEKGYDIVWKEHPRIDRPFFPYLLDTVQKSHRDCYDRITQADLPYALPVELITLDLNVVGCVAGTSAALMYLKWLYNIEAYTFADRLIPFMTEADLLMSDMIKTRTLSLESLQNANEPPRQTMRDH